MRKSLLGVLTAAVGIGPVIVFGLSALSSLLIRELGLTEGQIGLLASVCFAGATLSALVLGPLSDHIPDWVQLVTVFGGATLSFVLVGGATSYGMFLVAMLVSGVAMAMSTPFTNRIIVRMVVQQKRSQWAGVKQSGVQFGQFIVGFSFPALAIALGWREALFIGGAVTFSMLVVAVPIVALNRRRAESMPPPVTPEAPDAPAVPTVRLRTRPNSVSGRSWQTTIWLLAAVSLGAGLGSQTASVYLPLFAQERLGLSLVQAGMTLTLSGLLGVIARLLWGWLVDHGVRYERVLVLLGFLAVLGAFSLWASGYTQSVTLLWVGVSLNGVSALAVNVLVVTGVMARVPRDQVGKASGLAISGMYLGFTIGPAVAGWLISTTQSFSPVWLLISACYGGAFVLALVLARR